MGEEQSKMDKAKLSIDASRKVKIHRVNKIIDRMAIQGVPLRELIDVDNSLLARNILLGNNDEVVLSLLDYSVTNREIMTMMGVIRGDLQRLLQERARKSPDERATESQVEGVDISLGLFDYKPPVKIDADNKEDDDDFYKSIMAEYVAPVETTVTHFPTQVKSHDDYEGYGYIERLNVHSSRCRLPDPTYEFKRTGKSNKPIFTCKCSYVGKTSEGMGHTKRESKEEASKFMWDLIVDKPLVHEGLKIEMSESIRPPAAEYIALLDAVITKQVVNLSSGNEALKFTSDHETNKRLVFSYPSLLFNLQNFCGESNTWVDVLTAKDNETILKMSAKVTDKIRGDFNVWHDVTKLVVRSAFDFLEADVNFNEKFSHTEFMHMLANHRRVPMSLLDEIDNSFEGLNRLHFVQEEYTKPHRAFDMYVGQNWSLGETILFSLLFPTQFIDMTKCSPFMFEWVSGNMISHLCKMGVEKEKVELLFRKIKTSLGVYHRMMALVFFHSSDEVI